VAWPSGTGVGPGSKTGLLAGKTVINGGRSDCEFYFAVLMVPIQEGADIYSIEVSHRGKVQFTQEEGAAGLALTLGD